MAAWVNTTSQISMLFTKTGDFIHQNIFGRTCVLGGRRQWQPTPVLLPGKSHGWRSLIGCMGSLRVRFNWATSLSIFLSCIGEGNSNPPQCSCLENPRNGGAWWASIYGVAQSQTWMMQLGSSSSVLGEEASTKVALPKRNAQMWLTNAILNFPLATLGFRAVKNLPANARDTRDRFYTWVGKIPWRRKWQPTPIFLPG